MKTNLFIRLVGLFTVISFTVQAQQQLPSRAQLPNRAIVTGDARIAQIQGAPLRTQMTTVLARPGLSFAKQQLVASGFKQGSLDKDVLRITAKATLKDGSQQDIEVNLVGFEKDGEVAVVGNYQVGNQTYEAILQGKKGARLDQLEESEVVRVSNRLQLSKLPGGPSSEGYEPAMTYELRTVPPSRAKIRRFLSCLGRELKTSCTSQCSAQTLLSCAGAGGAVGVMIGAAIGSGAAGVGAVPGAVAGIVIGSIGGLTVCLGYTCGFCTAGQVIECSASLF